ncbi:MAG: hypothetical protein HWN67_13130 [Candidatus Helarchaeota archaeon]|nr:hypothetical protein [Candidatus Helarchaeota archaeon]
MLLGIFWIVITLIPVIRMFQRWYIYIPTVGLCIALSYLIFSFPIKVKRKKIIVSTFISVLILIIYTYSFLLEKNDWIETGNYSKNIVYNFKRDYPYLNINKNIVLINVPGVIKKNFVYMYGIKESLRFTYNKPNLKVVELSHVFLPDINSNTEILHSRDLSIFELSSNDPKFFMLFPKYELFLRGNIDIGDIAENEYAKVEIIDFNDYHRVSKVRIEIKQWLKEEESKIYFKFKNGRFVEIKNL